MSKLGLYLWSLFRSLFLGLLFFNLRSLTFLFLWTTQLILLSSKLVKFKTLKSLAKMTTSAFAFPDLFPTLLPWDPLEISLSLLISQHFGEPLLFRSFHCMPKIKRFCLTVEGTTHIFFLVHCMCLIQASPLKTAMLLLWKWSRVAWQVNITLHYLLIHKRILLRIWKYCVLHTHRCEGHVCLTSKRLSQSVLHNKACLLSVVLP